MDSFESMRESIKKRKKMETAGKLIAFLMVIFISVVVVKSNQVTYERSRVRIAEQVGSHKLIRSSNNAIFIGKPYDVVFQVRLDKDSTIASCRCTDGPFQPLLCRTYKAE